MTAAEILQNARPPVNDELIDKAIADLDLKISEWADALKGAHDQLRSAFAVVPVVPEVPEQPIQTKVAPRPSAALFDVVPSRPKASLSEAAAAAHIASPPPMPAEWTAPSKAPAYPAEAGGSVDPFARSGASAADSAWAKPSAKTDSGLTATPDGGLSGPSVMQWPSEAGSNNWGEPAEKQSAEGPQAWPTWTPTDTSSSSSSSKKSTQSGRPTKPNKPVRPAVEGPSPEERAEKAAAEEARLAQLDDSIARRVRLLRRLDPDTPIEKLIDKATQGQNEAAPESAPKSDTSGSSWWRRK